MSHHVVEPGDDLWSLAQRYYGDGASWRRIAQANQTVLLHDTDPATADALQSTLGLLSQHYQFVTISQLFELSPGDHGQYKGR